MRTVEPMRDDLLIGVQFIQNCIGVNLMARCKNYDFKLLGHFFQESHRIRSNVHPNFDFLSIDCHGQSEVSGNLKVFITVNEGFIKIQHKYFLFI